MIETARPIPAKAKSDTLGYVNHGGVAVVSKPGVVVSKIGIILKISTFGQLYCRVTSKGGSAIIVTIYRPESVPPSAAFLTEFNSSLEVLATISAPVTLTGDANIHLIREVDTDCKNSSPSLRYLACHNMFPCRPINSLIYLT